VASAAGTADLSPVGPSVPAGSSARESPVFSRSLRSLLAVVGRAGASRVPLASLAALAAAAACGEGGEPRLFGDAPGPTRWQRDSAYLDERPTLLFRVIPDASGALTIPIASMGPEGIRGLSLSDRAWRRVDREHMQAGRSLAALRGGRVTDSLRMFRGMWQPGAAPLDSLSCPVVVPVGRALRTGLATDPLGAFATNGPRPPLADERLRSAGEVERALANVGTLVAPSSGIPPGQLGRYRRRITQVPTGINGSSTLVVEYNDPTPLPDSIPAFGERPRQFIVVLDQGNFGVRPTYAFSTVGAGRTPPRQLFLDYLDVDDDGVPELLFGLEEPGPFAAYTSVLRYENDAWREVYRFNGNRCVL
jgi:hypothetical protein